MSNINLLIEGVCISNETLKLPNSDVIDMRDHRGAVEALSQWWWEQSEECNRCDSRFIAGLEQLHLQDCQG